MEGDSGLCDTCSRQMAEAGGTTTQWQLPAVGEHVRGNVSTAREDGRERTDIAMRVKELMDEMRGRCALCWWHGRREKHELRHCGYVHGHCLRCLDRGHKIRDCIKINFPRGEACFWCGFPQKLGGQHIHGEVRTGTCEPGLEDTVGALGGARMNDNVVVEGLLGRISREVLHRIYFGDIGEDMEIIIMEILIKLDNLINFCRYLC
jgi:hypothetical protein